MNTEKKYQPIRFNIFTPKVDINRRLVLTRFYCGIKGGNLYMYQIHKITLSETIDSEFKHLYAISDNEWDSVTQFYHSKTGEPVRVFKMDFKSYASPRPASKKLEIMDVWRDGIEYHLKNNTDATQ